MNFPDALAGAAVAGSVPGPVLLVATTGTINANTKAELLRLKPAHIVVLGSTGVVSAAVYNSLAPYAPAGQITRYWASDRYGTASSISSHTFAANCGCVVYIAAGTDFNGALAAAAAAGTIEGPLLLVATTGQIPAATVTELNRLKPTRIVVVGGTSQVSAGVYSLLAGYVH
jgi:putative cell wall-binding protein